jgi:S1-C subfamily serine protease
MPCQNPGMLTELSNELAAAVNAAAPSVVQVHGRRRPASGVVYADGVVVTTVRAMGREDGLRVRGHNGTVVDAELAGWDPATGLAVLRAPGLTAPPIAVAKAPAQVGHIALALARSWSNAITASAGIVSVIGGPLPTGRRSSIEQVIRTTAPMHDGFAGGAFLDTAGGLLGVSTSTSIRGLRVVIPVDIVWKTAATLLEHGSLRRGYLGVAGQPVAVPAHQHATEAGERALLVVAVTEGSPAAEAGVLVGDILVALDGQAIALPDDLLDLLAKHRVGQTVVLRVSRGGVATDVPVTIGERPRQ